MNIDKERAEFETASRKHAEEAGYDPDCVDFIRDGDGYANPARQAAWWGWKERASMQSHADDTLEALSYIKGLEDGRDAALQAQDEKARSRIRGKSYAGVYAWFGDEYIVEHIPKEVTENAKFPESIMAAVTENAISKLGRFEALKSKEREDAERLKQRLETIRALYPNAPSDAELDEAIDHARRIDGERN